MSGPVMDATADLPERPIPAKMTPEEVIDRIRAMAWRIKTSAEAAVEAGYREEPDPERMRDVEVLDAVSILLDVMLPHWADHRALVRRKRWGRG